MNEEKEMINSKWPKDLWAPLVLMVIGLIFASIFAAYVTYAYMDQFVADLPDPSRDFTYFLSTISLATIPVFIVSISLFLFLRTRTQGMAANRLKLVFFLAATLMVIGSSVNIVLYNVYFRSDRWIDHLDLVNHLTYFGELSNQIGFITCGVVAIFLIRAFLRGEIVGIRTK
ncbi:MAG: hypothetical protein AB9860_04795 [Methanomassiliicoccales archaeon]